MGGRKAFLQIVVEVIDPLLPALAQDEVFHHARLQWPRAVEREHGNDVFKLIGLQLQKITPHARRFHLKDASGVGVLQHLVGRRVIKSV